MINKTKLNRKDAMDLNRLEHVAWEHKQERIHVGAPLYNKFIESMDHNMQKLYRDEIRHQFVDKEGKCRVVKFLPVKGK